jgi:1-deoxy-D-xylulose-5-phosphate reductoisomerase
MKTVKHLVILGSTGSIGVNTLDVVKAHPGRLEVTALAAHRNWKLLARQIREVRPRVAVLFDPENLPLLREETRDCDVCLLSGMEGLLEIVGNPDGDAVVSAMVGAVGLQPVLAGIAAGKTICLANKETLVVGGALVTEAAATRGVEIIPVDSEHSAIFQCLLEENRRMVQRLVLTASGGPFRDLPADRLTAVTPAEALKHPNWNMGGKITIDSATLMNKGLEVIEAHWLFHIDFDRIEVIIHPQSVIHSMVEFVDGSILAQMGAPDMRGPIQYALSYPDRWDASGKRMNLLQTGPLTFSEPRWNDFPCLKMAFAAGRRGGNLPGIMNAANEVAVEAFLAGEIRFADIHPIISACMDAVPFVSNPDLNRLLEADLKTRRVAREMIAGLAGTGTLVGSANRT